MAEPTEQSHKTTIERDRLFIGASLAVGFVAVLGACVGIGILFALPTICMLLWFAVSVRSLHSERSTLPDHFAHGNELPERLAGTLIPPSFTALGILFTFLGLLHGLSDFSPNPDDLLESINTLVSGTRTAFWSSVIGISLSVLTSQIYQYHWRAYEDQKQHLILRGFLDNVTEVGAVNLLVDRPELALTMLLNETRKSNAKLETIAEVMMDEERQRKQLETLMEQFADAFTAQLGAKFEKMESVLDKFIDWNESSRDLYDASQKRMRSLNEQSEKLLESQDRILTDQTVISSKLSASTSTLSRASGSLEQVVIELGTQNQNLTEIKTKSDELLGEITDRLEQLQSIASVQTTVSQKQEEQLAKITSLEEGFKRTYEELANNTKVLNDTLDRETKLVDVLNKNLEEQENTSLRLKKIAEGLIITYKHMEPVPTTLQSLQEKSEKLLSEFKESLIVVQTSLEEAKQTSQSQSNLLARLEAVVANLGNLNTALDTLSSSNDKILENMQGIATHVAESTEKVSLSSTNLGDHISSFDESLGRLNQSMETVGNKIPTQFAELEERNAKHFETISAKTVAAAKMVEAIETATANQSKILTRLDQTSQNLGSFDSTLTEALGKLSAASQTISTAVYGLRDDIENVASTRKEMATDLSSIGSSLGDISSAMNQLKGLGTNLDAINNSLLSIFSDFDSESAQLAEHFIRSQQSLQSTLEDLDDMLRQHHARPEMPS